MNIKHFMTKQKAEEGTRLVIRDFDGTPTAMVIYVKGKDSKSYQDAFLSIQRARMENGEDGPTDYEVVRANATKLLVACCIRWEGFKDENDQDMPFNPSNLIFALTECPEIREQVDHAIGNRQLFING